MDLVRRGEERRKAARRAPPLRHRCPLVVAPVTLISDNEGTAETRVKYAAAVLKTLGVLEI